MRLKLTVLGVMLLVAIASVSRLAHAEGHPLSVDVQDDIYFRGDTVKFQILGEPNQTVRIIVFSQARDGNVSFHYIMDMRLDPNGSLNETFFAGHNRPLGKYYVEIESNNTTVRDSFVLTLNPEETALLFEEKGMKLLNQAIGVTLAFGFIICLFILSLGIYFLFKAYQKTAHDNDETTFLDRLAHKFKWFIFPGHRSLDDIQESDPLVALYQMREVTKVKRDILRKKFGTLQELEEKDKELKERLENIEKEIRDVAGKVLPSGRD